MRFFDERGLEVTALSQAAVDRLDGAVRACLAHGAETPDRVAEVFEADPSITLGHCLKGFLCKLLGRSALDAEVERCLQSARAALEERGGTLRERRHVQALEAYAHGDPVTAAQVLELVAEDEPWDILAIKLNHALQFVLGYCTGMRRATARVVPHWDGSVPGCGFVFGCHAFGLEETGAYEAAEAYGRNAVALEPRDAWGMHAVAHVMEMQGRRREGIAWIVAGEPNWQQCGNFAYHVAWHRALFHVDLNEFDAALRLYDTAIRAQKTDDYRDICNASTLLWRLECHGVEVDDRWEELADLAEGHIGDHALAFADSHYLLSLVGAGRVAEADQFADAIAQAAADRRTVQAGIGGTVGSGIAEALRALAHRRPGRAVDCLLPMREEVWRIGGSHAQRDIFEILLIEAAIAVGRRSVADSLVRNRLAARPADAWGMRWSAQLASGVNIPSAA